MGDIGSTLRRMFTERSPTASEMDFFGKNRNVAGYAAPDNSVVMNPFGVTAGNAPAKNALFINEATRLFLRQHPMEFSFSVTPQQQQNMGQAYMNNPVASQHSLLARILSGDPSAGQPTIPQMQALSQLRARIMGMK